MKKKQFDKLAELLYSRGYKKYGQTWHNEDYVIAKGFHKEDNKWEENRSAYQIVLSVYDYFSRKDLWDRLSEKERDHVGIEVHVDMSRTIDERFDFVFAWHNDDNIEEIERIAEKYYQFMCRLFNEPRAYI